ncbi:tumor necrosis factor receptor superfamily member 13C isoform X2 [Vulpes lagopus]|uniref:tumor necrosis factor receptor superfamily member 13C isoform X2 n=1 Tax=Vulpes lagopus TaxID=494514 RepID=UPI001BC9B5C0|nr:tumor necrosis factor receptor superfamily member 13C isoform X2 [Vulpes lagopus]
MEEPQVEREGVGCGALRVVPPQQAGGWGGAQWVAAPPGFLLWEPKPGSVPRERALGTAGSMGSDRRGARGPRGRSPRGRDGPAPTRCVQAECFDPLVRNCVACKLLRTPEPRPAAGPSSLAPGTALQPQESVGPGAAAEAEAALPLPALLFGAPALLGLALALVLLGLLGWRWRRRLRAAAPPGAPDPRPHPHPHPRGKFCGAGGREAGPGRSGGVQRIGPVPRGRDAALAPEPPEPHTGGPRFSLPPALPICTSCPEGPTHATLPHPCRASGFFSVPGGPSPEASRTGVGKSCEPP